VRISGAAVWFSSLTGKGCDDTGVVLAYDSPQPAEERRCDQCGRSYLLVRAFITRDGGAYAIVFAACHVHEGEAWIDVILGTFSSDDAPDHVTFGARVGPVAGQADPAATAVPAAAGYSQSPFWGIKLSRDEALAHPRIDEFWEIVDYVLLTDPVVHAHVYGHELSTLARAGRSLAGIHPGERHQRHREWTFPKQDERVQLIRALRL
jgi:hypothetical protein